jgi:hypothetical protein
MDDKNIMIWPLLLLLWSAVMSLLHWRTWFWHLLKDPWIQKFFLVRYIIPASKHSRLCRGLCLYHPHDPDLQFSTDHGNGGSKLQWNICIYSPFDMASFAEDSNLYQHCCEILTFCSLECLVCVRHIHKIRSDVRECILFWVLLYSSNSKWGRNFFVSVTFVTRGKFWEWIDEWINEHLNTHIAPGGISHILCDCSLG